MKKIILVLIAVFLASSVYAGHNSNFQEGFTLTSWWNNDYFSSKTDSSINMLDNSGVEYVSLLVTQYIDTKSSNLIYSDSYKTPSDSALIHAINDIHNKGMKVMLKPHINVKDGTPRTDISPSNWDTWFTSYRSFINHYADLADANDVEFFVVGTELKTSTYRNSDWQSIISDVRSRFSGNITYAANWDNYNNIGWWNQLDYIGIDAYFPLTTDNNSNLAQLKSAWIPIKNSISSLSSSQGMNVILTEVGYQSRDGTNTYPPWVGGRYDQEEQEDCYKAVFETFWNESWVEGMYWWHWYYDYVNDPDDFVVYGKPSRTVVENYYIDNTAPASVTNLDTISKSYYYIYWQWDNPSDSDFKENRIYLNGIYVGSTSNNYYNASGLDGDTLYTIKVHTVDNNDNVNTNDVTDTERTDVAPCDEDWQLNYSQCFVTNFKQKIYFDANSCGTSISLPSDNGTYEVCDYCLPDWQPYTTGCNGSFITQYYVDDNNCYDQTGLVSDKDGQPGNFSLPCGTNDCVVPYNGMIINESVKFCPAEYTLAGSIQVVSNDTIVDCDGARLIGSDKSDYNIVGILVKNYTTEFNNISIINCDFENFNTAIRFNKVYNSLILNNNFYNNINAVYSYYSANNSFISNEFDSGNYKAFYYTVSYDSLFFNNTFSNAIFHLDSGRRNNISNNVFRNSDSFSLLVVSNNNYIQNNDFINNNIGLEISYSPGRRGYDYPSRHNVVQNNNFYNNSYGFVIDASEYNNVSNNVFYKNNIYGINIITGKLNLIYDNNFTENNVHAFDSGESIWSYNLTGNYWDNSSEYYGCNNEYWVAPLFTNVDYYQKHAHYFQ
jgi:parallel beta-helix repeat protein